MASLFVIQGYDQGRRLELEDTPITIGRDRNNGFHLEDTEISRQHVELRPAEDGYILTDLNSSNGTFVNNQEVKQCELTNGDRIQLGRTLMIFTHADQHVDTVSGQIDIIGDSPAAEESRIIKSISHEEGSQIFMLPKKDQDSQWLDSARDNLQLMYHTALAVSRTLDIDQLLDYIMGLIFDWIDADRGCIMLYDLESGELEAHAHRERKDRGKDKEPLHISKTILDYVLNQKEGVLTSDAGEDQRWDAGGSIINIGVREAICVPMQGRYGIVGIIYVDTYTPPGSITDINQKNSFNEDHLKLMVAIAHQAALAVEDTHYYSALVQSERLAAVGQAVAAISHHVKNILQGISGGSYLVKEGLKSEKNDVIRKGWEIVEKNQAKISDLVMDMLSFSKEREPEQTLANPCDVVQEVVELMQNRAEKFGVNCECITDENMPEFYFDIDGIHKALLNVVTNAIDASAEEENGQVTVTCHLEKQRNSIQITVEDNGHGIPEEQLEKIFTAFESTKGSQGTGLGLPISRKVLREHGGDIQVTSQINQGSRFLLEFPVVLTPDN
ncbi:MAG: histidine kinase [Blastopirellula sp.]|nr:MAG: histidine kinase [Blastopirellula sp.]